MTDYSPDIKHQQKSEVGDGVYRFKTKTDESVYGACLDNFPKDVRADIREDYKAAEILFSSLEEFNFPKISLEVLDGEEVYLIEDKGEGKTDETSSFYEAAGLHLLTSKTDVRGNIVEGDEGYAPIDFEAFLRSPLTEKASYLKYGRKFETANELYKHSIAEIEEEADRHNIEFESAELLQATIRVANSLEGATEKLEQEGLNTRANNLELNIDLILEGQIDIVN